MSPDRDLLYRISEALGEAQRRSGDWIACRPGCFECCIGPFSISGSDAERLREGLRAVEPEVARRIGERTRAYAAAMGELDEDGLPEGMDEVPCPALDPASGRCDLYEWRPVTCRTFGPAIRTGAAIGACELCYVGATEEQVAGCAVDLDLEDEPGVTTVAGALNEAFQ